jgi:hypothetical protein
MGYQDKIYKEKRDQIYFLREYGLMKKIIHAFTIVITLLGLYAQSSYADTETTLPQVDAPVIVELFTSQGCPACPPADKILAELSKDKNVIALGCHVTYMDRPQWKDTFSNQFCDIRQHGIQGLRKERRIYTPQMVVNGQYVFVGSNMAKLSFALDRAQQQSILPITRESTEDASAPDIIKIKMPPAEQGDYRLWGFGYKNSVTTDIKSGSNSGQKIDYIAPVITYSNLGPWDGTQNTLSFERPDGNIDGIVIFGQKDGYGKIVAAGKLEL